MEKTTFADTTVSRCTYYRRTCGLPAGIQPPLGRIVVRAGMIGAITMPGRLGQRIRDDLLHHRITLGPIICHVRSGRWTYLCRPDLPDDVQLFRILFALNTSIVPAGSEIALPSPTDTRSEYRCWIVPPRDTFRPSGLVIVDAIEKVTK